MHIPDGLLSPVVWAPLDALAMFTVLRVSYSLEKKPAERRGVSLAQAGCLGAFVFAAQMINFPVGPGISTHLIGVSLLNTLLGPAWALLLMTSILGVQAVVFQDGGVLAFGANLLNLGIGGILASEACLRFFSSRRKMACFSGAALSVVTGYGFLLLEMLGSGIKLSPAIWIGMTGFVCLSAFAEGAITVTVLSMLGRTQPHWQKSVQPKERSKWALLGVVAVLLAGVGAWWASPLPDLLEFGMEGQGIAGRAQTLFQTAFTDYEWQRMNSEWLRKSIAGLLGVALVFGVSTAVFRRWSGSPASSQ
jgi:cobalt/nickel transport system permease protein